MVSISVNLVKEHLRLKPDEVWIVGCGVQCLHGVVGGMAAESLELRLEQVGRAHLCTRCVCACSWP